MPAAVVLLAGMIGLPFVVGEYHVEVLILFLINIMLATSYRLIATVGDWSFSHIVFMGCGAYATALLAKHLGWPFWATVPLSGAAAAAIGLAIVVPLLRTRGFGFFIGSFALGEFVRLSWVRFHNPFGGMRGMIDIPEIELGDIDFFDATPYYFVTLVITVICLGVLYRIDRSRSGRVLKAIYSDEALMASVGVNVSYFRAAAFTVSAFFAGIAGAMLAHRLGAIDPHNFDINTMVYLIIWVVVGGTATFWGPISGVIVISLIFELSRPLAEWRPLLFGAILIFFLVIMPGGFEVLFPKLASFRDKIGWGRATTAKTSSSVAKTNSD